MQNSDIDDQMVYDEENEEDDEDIVDEIIPENEDDEDNNPDPDLSQVNNQMTMKKPPSKRKHIKANNQQQQQNDNIDDLGDNEQDEMDKIKSIKKKIKMNKINEEKNKKLQNENSFDINQKKILVVFSDGPREIDPDKDKVFSLVCMNCYRYTKNQPLQTVITLKSILQKIGCICDSRNTFEIINTKDWLKDAHIFNFNLQLYEPEYMKAIYMSSFMNKYKGIAKNS